MDLDEDSPAANMGVMGQDCEAAGQAIVEVVRQEYSMSPMSCSMVCMVGERQIEIENQERLSEGRVVLARLNFEGETSYHCLSTHYEVSLTY